MTTTRPSPLPLGSFETAWRQTLAWGATTVLSVGVAVFSYRYLFGNTSAPRIIAANRHLNP